MGMSEQRLHPGIKTVSGPTVKGTRLKEVHHSDQEQHAGDLERARHQASKREGERERGVFLDFRERIRAMLLIATEAVFNSLRRAFSARRRARILVRLDRPGDTCELFVGDDGPGAAATMPSGRGVGMPLVALPLHQRRGAASPAEYDSLAGTSGPWMAS